jgi:type II secretory pathway component GspD/PulD (secretin)
MLSGNPRHGGLFQRRRLVAVLVGISLLAGCRAIPMPQPKSIEELYEEAVSVAKPEANLGMHYPRNTDVVMETSLAPSVPTGAQPPVLMPVPAATLPTDAAPAVPPPPAPEPPATSAVPTGSGPILPVNATTQIEKPVSDIFAETDVRQAVQSLATQAGVSVVLDNTATGEVTCNIENEPFERALQRILLPLGLVYRKRDNVYLIGSNEPTSNLFPHIAESMDYRPQHLSAQELLALLPTRQSQFVRMVDKRNLIVIEAPKDTAQQIYTQLQCADQPIPQIMIEALICVVAPDKGLQFGMDWNHGLQVQGIDRLNVGLSGLSFTGQVSPYGANNAFDDFAVTSAFVKLLAKEGYVTIRAAPRVMAKDGEKAEISIARDTFFAIQQGNNQFLFNQNIQKVESGISLNLTPSIRGETVQIQIEKAEVSEDLRTIDPNQQITNNPYPIINRRNVATIVQVKDRQTIVIGGLMQKQMVDRETRIPFLGAMPWVGGVFRKTEKQETEAEVAIFISPTIVVPTAAPSNPVMEVHSLIPPVPPATPNPDSTAPNTVLPDTDAPAPTEVVIPELRALPMN